jgi:hypothetical protein
MLFIQQKCIILTVGAMHCIISLAHIPRKRETTYLMFNICTSFRTGKPIREIAENQKYKEMWNERQTLSHNVVSSTPRHDRDLISQL